MNNVAVYLHWPFCVAKCPYCDFVSYPCSGCDLSKYEQLLLDDLKLTIAQLNIDSVSSVFFGGGTPSLMSARAVENILDFISPKFENKIEITLEANPATFDKTKLRDLRTAGINRLSLGVQSFHEDNLKFLGRIYSGKQAEISAGLVSEIFDNFSFDFMYGYQSLDSLLADLQFAVNLGTKHLSCYQLTLEAGTPFYAKFTRDGVDFESRDYMSDIENFLAAHRIFRYEISNFSKENFQSKHNITYWNYGNYLGCGASAHSRLMIDGRKHATTKFANLKQWEDHIGQWDVDKALSDEEILEEMIITGLRKISGVEFSELFQQVPKEVVQKIITKDKIDFLKKYKLIFRKTDRLQLTKSGLQKLNSVIASLLD